MGLPLFPIGLWARSTLWDGLSLYLKNDEAGGTRADSSGSVTAFTDNNTTLGVAGKIGNAAAFVAASTQGLNHADAPSLRIATSSTLSAWVKLTSKPGQMRLVSKDFAPADREYLLYYEPSNDRYGFAVFVGGVGAGLKTVLASSFGSPALGTWHYLTAGYNAASQQLFISVNGGAVNTTSSVASAFGGTSALWIGRYQTGIECLNGALDEIKLWNTRVLLPAEVALDYANGLAGIPLL